MRRLSLSFSVTALAAVALIAQDAAAQCQGPFTGGAVPSVPAGGGGGAFPGTLPTNPGVFTGVVSAPAPGHVLKSVKLNGLSHVWGGDTQVFIESPAQPGVLHNVYCLFPQDPNVTWTSQNYEFVDPVANPGTPLFAQGAGAPLANGTYGQFFNGFAGPANTANTPLESIPVSAGTWTLHAYDWFATEDGSLVDWELCFGAPTGALPPCAAGTCVTGGAGGAIPAGTGAANGVWGTTLPTLPMVSTASIATPAGATALQSVKLLGLTHTWRSDVMVVLTAPNGTDHVIYAEDNSTLCPGTVGLSYGGDYAFVDATTCAAANGSIQSAGTLAPSGEYTQAFGGWPNGGAGLNNTPISAIPVPAGTNSWTLSIYDWCPQFDNGTIVGFELCFAAPVAPAAYCTAGTTTSGCNATISANVNPNVANNAGVTISVATVEGDKQGILFYGLDNSSFTPAPWFAGSSSFICVKGPTQRAGQQGSGGAANTCGGAFSLNWDAFVAANPTANGVPFSAGDKIYVQAWFRDPPAPKTTNLSNAIEMTVQP